MTDDDRVRQLEARVAQLSDQLGRLEDAKAVRELQHTYGYYMDRLLFDHVVTLFDDDCEIRFMGGVFRGRKGAERMFLENLGRNYSNGTNRPVRGFLAEHIMLQDVVHVAEDGRTARARLRLLMQAGWHETVRGQRIQAEGQVGIPRELSQWWEGGLYENEYVKSGGVWKIKLLEFRLIYHASFEHGWAHTLPGFVPWFTRTFPDDPLGPDEIIDPPWVAWPDLDVLPFHYPNPVTGQPVIP